MKRINIFLSMAICLSLVGGVFAETINYGWETGSGDAILGSYGNVGSAEFSAEQAHSGSYSMKLTEDPMGGTPQAYLAWITGLQEGDEVTASVWIQSFNGVDELPRGRIWGHYSAGDDINAYAGSASGPDTYGGAVDWEQAEYTWTIPAGQEALVIEGRIYSTGAVGDGLNVVYFDDICVTVPDHATVTVVPEPTTLALLFAGLALFGFLRRK